MINERAEPHNFSIGNLVEVYVPGRENTQGPTQNRDILSKDIEQFHVISSMESEGARVKMNSSDGKLLGDIFKTRWYAKTWKAQNPEDERRAARALALGVPVFAPFAYFYGMFGHPSIAAIRHLNKLKGRPEDQVISITTTAPHIEGLFNWQFYPSQEYRQRILSFLNNVLEIGPIGVKGPARMDMHSLVTKSMDYPGLGEVNTVQAIMPGYNCIGNTFIAECLRETGNDFIVATSPNKSRNLTGGESAPHWLMCGIQSDFGFEGRTVLLAHPKEKSRGEQFPVFSHRSSTTIVDVTDASIEEGGKLGIKLIRHGSWPLDLLKSVAEQSGVVITHDPNIEDQRLPQNIYGRWWRFQNTLNRLTNFMVG